MSSERNSTSASEENSTHPAEAATANFTVKVVKLSAAPIELSQCQARRLNCGCGATVRRTPLHM